MVEAYSKMRRKKALWLGKDIMNKLESFISEELELEPEILINDVAKKGILYALEDPEGFKEFLKPKKGKKVDES